MREEGAVVTVQSLSLKGHCPLEAALPLSAGVGGAHLSACGLCLSPTGLVLPLGLGTCHSLGLENSSPRFL